MEQERIAVILPARNEATAIGKVIDEEKAQGLDGFDQIDTERIAEILSSCDMRRCDQYIIIPRNKKEGG